MGNSASTAQDVNTHSPAYQSLSKIPGRKSASRPASSSGGPPSHSLSTSPSTGQWTTHPSMRSKKKSLELPDLASLSISANSSASRVTEGRSAPIPIPAPAQAVNPQTSGHHAIKGKQSNQRARPYLTDSSQQLANREEPERENTQPAQERGRKQASEEQERGRPRWDTRQDYSKQSKSRTRSQPSRGPSVHSKLPSPTSARETLRSALPSFSPRQPRQLTTELPNLLSVSAGTENDEVQPVQIIWRGGATHVSVEHADESEWSTATNQQDLVPMPMVPSAEDPEVWTTTIPLEPGMHHLRFVVDGIPRLADDLPTAVDDAGNLANFVAIEPPPPPATPPLALYPNAEVVGQGNSFWSTASGSASNASGSPPDSSDVHSYRRPQGKWTNVIPPELEAAAHEEEVYLSRTTQDNEDDTSDPGSDDYAEAPNVPPAPRLPRHLDKLILNMRDSRAMDSGSSSSTRTRDRRRLTANAVGPLTPTSEGIPVSTASGTHLPLPQITTVAKGNGSAGSNLSPILPLTPAITAGSSQNKKPGQSNATVLGMTHPSDDTSILPIPSHVVLHHLSTSAIKNGVLAVANTTRYLEKYMTTVYYKPT